MIPLELEIKNFLSHRESFLDFSKFQSALIIGNIDGNYEFSNGSGKSALLASILWCLFNKSRVANADDVVLWGENLCKVAFTFRHFDKIYKVVRKRNRTNSTTSVEFLQFIDNEWNNISGSTSSLTNTEIEKTIKFDYKTFISSVYFGQNDISEFADSDPAKKKTILKSIIDLSKWDQYEEKAKERLKLLKVDSKILESKLENYDQFVKEHADCTLLLQHNKKNHLQLLSDRTDLQHKLDSNLEKYNGLKKEINTNLWDDTIKELDKLKTESITLDSNLSKCISKINHYNQNINQSNASKTSLLTKISNIKLDPDILLKITNANNDIIDFKSKLGVAEHTILESKKKIILNDSCYVCQQPIDNLLFNKLNDEKIETESLNEKQIIYFKNKINEVKSNLAVLNKQKQDIDDLHLVELKLKSIESQLTLDNDRLNEYVNEESIIKSKISKVKSDIDNCKNILVSITNNDFKLLQKDINDKKAMVTALSKDIDSLNHSMGILTERGRTLNDKILKMNSYKNDFQKLQKNIVIFEKTSKFLGKNGIQTILLNAVIDDLEKTSNDILSSICNEDFIVYLDTQRVGSDGSIVDTLDLRVKKDGVIQNFKSLSGGEQFRISLALRIGLSEISSRHGGTALEFLLLDEINSPLDRHGTESLFVNVIAALEKKYKILIITHNDFLKEKFNNIIEVTKTNGESTISFRNDL